MSLSATIERRNVSFFCLRQQFVYINTLLKILDHTIELMAAIVSRNKNFVLKFSHCIFDFFNWFLTWTENVGLHISRQVNMQGFYNIFHDELLMQNWKLIIYRNWIFSQFLFISVCCVNVKKSNVGVFMLHKKKICSYSFEWHLFLFPILIINRVVSLETCKPVFRTSWLQL